MVFSGGCWDLVYVEECFGRLVGILSACGFEGWMGALCSCGFEDCLVVLCGGGNVSLSSSVGM